MFAFVSCYQLLRNFTGKTAIQDPSEEVSDN